MASRYCAVRFPRRFIQNKIDTFTGLQTCIKIYDIAFYKCIIWMFQKGSTFSCFPVDRLSRRCTRYPIFKIASHKLEPINPAPPVTKKGCPVGISNHYTPFLSLLLIISNSYILLKHILLYPILLLRPQLPFLFSPFLNIASNCLIEIFANSL